MDGGNHEQRLPPGPDCKAGHGPFFQHDPHEKVTLFAQREGSAVLIAGATLGAAWHPLFPALLEEALSRVSRSKRNLMAHVAQNKTARQGHRKHKQSRLTRP